MLREQIDKHGGPGNWTAIAEALVGRSSKSCRLRCARLRTHPRARDAAGIAVRSPRAPPVISHRAARAFPGLILERRPPHPLASPRVPSPFLTNRSLLFPLSLFLRNTRRWCNQLNPTVKRGPFTEEEDKEILAAHAVYGNKWAVISRGIPGRYGRDARAPRHTPKPRFNTLGTHSRDSVRSFRRATLNRRFVVHAPQPGTFARFFETPLADLPIAFAGKPRLRLFGLAFSPIGRMSVFRITRPRRRLKLKGRASVETRGVFVRVTDGETRAERTARALPHTSDDMSRSSSTTTDRKRNHPVSCVVCRLFTSTSFAGRITR